MIMTLEHTNKGHSAYNGTNNSEIRDAGHDLTMCISFHPSYGRAASRLSDKVLTPKGCKLYHSRAPVLSGF